MASCGKGIRFGTNVSEKIQDATWCVPCTKCLNENDLEPGT